MLRNDGKYMFYKIQHQYYEDGEWVFSSYGEPEIESKNDDFFTASGKCWQTTGQYGVFSLVSALAGLRVARAKVVMDFKEHKICREFPLRLVRVNITQKTTIVIIEE